MSIIEVGEIRVKVGCLESPPCPVILARDLIILSNCFLRRVVISYFRFKNSTPDKVSVTIPDLYVI